MSTIFLIFLALPLCIHARETDRTAEEIIREGDHALAEQRWGDAAALYAQFLKDFSSAAALPLLHRIRMAIASCYMSQGDFSSALSVIPRALESVLDSKNSQQQMIREKWNLLLWKGRAQLETGAASEAAESFAELLHLPSIGKEKHRNEVLLLRTRALIQAGKTREAIQWIEEQNISTLPEDYRPQLQLLKVEALLLGGEETTALQALLENSSSLPSVQFQILAITLAKSLMQQGKPSLALQALSRTLSKNEILKNQNTEKILIPPLTSPDEEEGLQPGKPSCPNLKALEQFKNWNDAVLLLRASAFLDLQRYREAALALESLQQPGIDEFITTLRCWLLAENPHRCLNLIQKSSAPFSSSSKWGLIQLLKGTTLLMLEDHAAALHAFRSIQSGEFVESARVQEIKALLLVHQAEEALQIISSFSYPHSPFLEEVLYLRGVALSYKEEYDACRQAMNDLLQRFPQGERAASAHFLRASAAHRKMDFPVAISEFYLTLQKFPGFPDEPEAWLLLGDALLDQGKIDDGIAAYRKVPCSSLGFHEIAIFRLSKVLKKLGKLEELKKEMETFQRDHPESLRLAEAIRAIGGIYQEKKKTECIYPLYWEAIQQQGARPDAHAIEILLQDLQKLYTTQGKLEEYHQQLKELRQQAEIQGKSILAFRLIWAESGLLADPLKRAQFISEWIQEGSIQKQASSRILCDFADTLFTAKKFDHAQQLYQSILKWHPSTNERDRALAGLARQAQQNGDLKKSLSYWKQLLQQMPESRFVPEAELAVVLECMKTKHTEEAIAGWKRILQHDRSTREQKVEALYGLGEIHMHRGEPALAMPYFQRIYIAYGAEKKWVAQAYSRSATAFQLLGDLRSMQRTYEEMISREDLKEFPEYYVAKEKLVQIEKY